MYNNINSLQLLFGWLSCCCSTYLVPVQRYMWDDNIFKFIYYATINLRHGSIVVHPKVINHFGCQELDKLSLLYFFCIKI